MNTKILYLGVQRGEMMKKKIHVLIFQESDGDGTVDETNIAASLSLERLKKYRRKLIEKSSTIRKKIVDLEQDRMSRCEPVYKEIYKSRKANKHYKVTQLSQKIREINSEFHGKKDELLDSMDVEYWIDDEELAGYEISNVKEI